MKRKFGFRPSLREQQSAVARQLQFMAGAAPDDKRDAAQAMADAASAAVKPKRERAAPRQLEAPVVAAINDLLAVHPRILWAARFNSGAASYEAASGNYAPVWFHRFVRKPDDILLPDFYGELFFSHTCGIWTKPIAIECKAPGWSGPGQGHSATHVRERKQAAFLQMIRKANGIALFATDVSQVAAALA